MARTSVSEVSHFLNVDLASVQGGNGTPFAARIETSTLRRVAEVGGALVITVYARTRSARPRSTP